jgi:hypothetical protein
MNRQSLWALASYVTIYDYAYLDIFYSDSFGREIGPSQEPVPYKKFNTHKKNTFMIPVGFKPVIPARSSHKLTP